MNEYLSSSMFACVVFSLGIYMFAMALKQKFKLAIFNPLLISIVVVIVVLCVFNIDYVVYNNGAKYLSWLLTPATVCLAIPMYEQFELLKNNWLAVLVSLLSGVITSLVSVFLLSVIFKLSHVVYVTLLPKSITTAIGMGVSEELGGIVTITVAVIVVTGVIGNIIGEAVCKMFKIKNPISVGLALGAAAHVIGTAKANELGEVQGAMSSLAIVISGIITVLLAPIFAMFI